MGVWRTVCGRRIYIEDGEDLQSAMDKSGKFEDDKKWKYPTWINKLEQLQKEVEKLNDPFSNKAFSLYNAITSLDKAITEELDAVRRGDEKDGSEKSLYTLRRQTRQLKTKLLNKGMNANIRAAAKR